MKHEFPRGARVIICGHGPSMLENERGDFIDAHDIVIRQKQAARLLAHPQYFGTRTDILCGSWKVAHTLPGQVQGCKYWVFTDSRKELTREEINELQDSVPCKIYKGLCDHWDAEYRKTRKTLTLHPGQERKESSDDLGHLHMSSGLHCLVYACDKLFPKEVTLVGYDNVRSGGFTWSVTRGPEWTQYADHNWATEHEMVKKISDFYGVRVEYE